MKKRILVTRIIKNKTSYKRALKPSFVALLYSF